MHRQEDYNIGAFRPPTTFIFTESQVTMVLFSIRIHQAHAC